jgi:AcrR family transcriptional regulator
MRKRPQQARSRATVDAILQAATQVLGRDGWGDFNTNRVAEVAGASVGTVYQYFPNKLALVEAIRHQHFEAIVTVVQAAADSATTLPERIDALVGGMIEVHGVSPRFHRALLDDAPRSVRTTAADEQLEHAYLGAYERLIARGGDGSRKDCIEISARLLSSAVEGAIHDGARRGLLASRALRHEFKVLVHRYLG